MASRVGGDRVHVTALVGPQQDAHVYEPSPADAARITKARLVISNGLGFEGWIDRLISSSGYLGPRLVATKGLEPQAAGGHAGAAGQVADPHAWQDLRNALVYVSNLKQGLCAIDASGCAGYTENAQAYAAEISTLDKQIKSDIAAVPGAKRKVITSHDAFGYFATAYGIDFMAPAAVTTASEASAKDVARLIDQIRTLNVTTLFIESISDRRLIEQIARETRVQVGQPLYSDALSNASGPAPTYLTMMRYNARELVQAMSQP